LTHAANYFIGYLNLTGYRRRRAGDRAAQRGADREHRAGMWRVMHVPVGDGASGYTVGKVAKC
jgi:hypothetical protein